MNDLDRRAARGIQVLVGRQALLQVLTLATGILLARTLTPAQFGLFFIAFFFVGIFSFLGDFGIAASLIQRREEPTTRELRVGFTLQQVIVTAIVGVLFVAAPWIVRLYHDAPAHAAAFIRVLALTLYLDACKAPSMLQLERSLRYRRVAVVEVAEALVYQATALSLALSGFGVWSLVAAAMARSATGAVSAFSVAPWRIGLAFDRSVARQLLRFGVPFQLAGVAQQAGAWLTPVFVGALVGPHAVGLLTWASSNARKPLMLVENVMRVSFPHVSRLQDDRREVDRVVEKYLRLLLLGSSLWLVGVVVAAPALVPVVYGDRWRDAVPALLIFSGALVFDTAAWVLGITAAGLGLPGRLARANLARTVVSVGFGVALVLLIGFNGAAVATVLGSVTVTAWLLGTIGGGRMLLRRLVPVAAPPAAGLAAGLLARMAPLPVTAGSLVAGAIAVSAFALTAVVLGLVPGPRRGRAMAPRVEAEGAA